MSDRPPEEPLDDRILAGWRSVEPPAGFAERTLDVIASRAPSPIRSSRRTRWVVGLSLAAALAGAGVWALSARPERSSGVQTASARTSIPIGKRAVAVAEPSAELAWRVDGDAAHVEQTTGEVFYRVEHGGPFEVATPNGVIEVRGTCFRVEVMPVSRWRDRWFGVAAGAAATVTVVLVLEGSVMLKNGKGAVEVRAGDSAAAVEGQAPEMAPAQVEEEHRRAAADDAEAREPSGREAAQQETIAALQAELKRLKRKEKERAVAEGADGPPKDKFFDFTKDELVALADRCEIRYDIPAYGLEEHPKELGEDKARELGLSAVEREHLNRILGAGDEALTKQMRAIYVEVTGDAAGATTLSLRNLQHEVFEKSSPQAMAEALERLARERAGLAKPPKSLDGTTAIERLLRALSVSGDGFERALGEAIGRERAGELRKKGIGFGRRAQAQCPDELE